MTSIRDGVTTGHAKMRPRARLISLLGDELISDEPVAVVELVKNAYDADAKKVSVVFEINESGVPVRLIIKDDGIGMDLATVMTGWLEPGTVLKKQSDRSPGGRLYQGAKGVGRFAAARLGDSLIMETRKKGATQVVTVLLEWGKFDDDSYLDDVAITYETTGSSQHVEGTTLTIEGLQNRKAWEEQDFKRLHERLSRLISPFDEVKDFRIDLQIPGHPELTGEVEPHALIKKPKYRLVGALSEYGILSATLEVDGKKVKTYKTHQLGGKSEKVGCGQFDLDIRVWDRDRPGLSHYMIEYNKSLTGVREILDSYCGVSIYRDGFRVHPYGEPGDDWLQLDNRSRQNPTMQLAKNQVIASIRTSRKNNPELKDRTTREGLVHNLAYEQLIHWFKLVLIVLEEERYRLRPREDAKPEYTTSLFEAFDLTEVVHEADRQLGKKHPVAKLVRDKDSEIRDGVRKLQEHYSRVLLAAGLGQLVDLVIHEIGAPLGRINRELAYLEKIASKQDLDDEFASQLEGSFVSIKSWLEQIANFRQQLDPKTAGKRGRATSFNVAEEIVGNLNLFENLLAKQKIKISFKEPKTPLVVHMPRSNLGQIIANLLDNSIFWLTRHHGDGKGGRIDIQLSSIENGFKIRLSDDGPGVAEQDRERIFEQYFTTKPNGMGLGLYIARQVIEPFGKLIYRDDCKLSGACFETIFERKVGL